MLLLTHKLMVNQSGLFTFSRLCFALVFFLGRVVGRMSEFAYYNNYLSSIQMAPYEALYGGRCISPLCWKTLGEIPGWPRLRDP